MSEKLRVLEVGFGGNPAVINGGTIFDSSSTTYYGVDVMKDTNFRGEPLYFNERVNALYWIGHTRRELDKEKVKGKEVPEAHFVQASVHALPFENDQFNYILMRSVFGQFTSPASRWPTHLDTVRGKGVDECYRVLKPGGEIVILEENTPWEAGLIKSYLKDAGFSIEGYAKMDGPFEKEGKNKLWTKLREPFFKTHPTHGPSYFLGSPYIVVGKKSEK